MKTLLLIIIFITSFFFVNAQHKTDTTFTLDSVWRNDTLFLVNTMHLTVIVEDTNKISTPKTDTNNTNFQSNISSNTYIKKPTKKHNLLKTNIYPYLEFGFFRTTDSPPNTMFDTTIFNSHTTTYGLGFEIEQKRFLYSTGFQITNYYENFKLKNNWETIDSSILTNVEVNSHWNIDTIWFINLDSLLIGDTVWMPYFDSTLINEYDTSYTTDYDTIFHNSEYDRINRIRYVEFPLIFGFHFGKRKWKYYVRTGLITGISISKNYKIALPKEQGVIEGKFVDFSFWIYTKISVQYAFTDKFSAIIGIYGRIPINNQLLVLNTHRKYYSAGFSFGVSWKIL